jgi:uncharacterized protein (TIGR03067 family)
LPGKKISGRRGDQMWLTFTPDKVIWSFDTPEGKKVYDGVYHVEPAKSPKEIELSHPIHPAPGELMRGLYKVEGDKLIIVGGWQRPKLFSDDALIRLELKRVKFPP